MKTVCIKYYLSEENTYTRREIENLEDKEYNTLESLFKDFPQNEKFAMLTLSELMDELNDEVYPTDCFITYVKVSNEILTHFGLSIY